MTKSSRALEAIFRDCAAFLEEVYRDEPKVPVFGEGDPASPLMMVGEAPGAEETRLRRPFVGKAGKNLDEFLQVVNLKREDLYITNVVKFRPTKTHERTGSLSNRPPTKEEILICMRFLWREIETVQPSVIVTLGNTPLQALLEDPKATIGTLHGQEIPGQHGDARYILFPLYHPASLIYNRSLAPVYRQDLEKLRRFLTLQDIFPD